jgi:hypothetical protein
MSYLGLDNTYADNYRFFDGVYYTKGFLNCYVDDTGATFIYDATEPQFLIVNSNSVVVDGQNGNSISPFDSLCSKPDIVVYDQKLFKLSNMP